MVLERKVKLAATILTNPFIPWTPTVKQVEFLAYDGPECMYGGAGGGGKSVAMLMAALQYVEVPGYNAIILRRTYPQLAMAGSVLDLSKQWLMGTGAKWNGDEYKWTFPSGATLRFGHLQHSDSVYNYQGAQFSFVGFDELTQFEEDQYRYLFSRVRVPVGSKFPSRVRATSNPGGVGHVWVWKRFVGPMRTKHFVAATRRDNPHLDQEDYGKRLQELPFLLRKQIDDGDWDAVEGQRFRRDYFKYYEFINAAQTHVKVDRDILLVSSLVKFITVDPAASETQSSDDTAISVWALTRKGDLLWLDAVGVKLNIPDIPPVIAERHRRWKSTCTGIEAIASNVAVYQLCKQWSNPVLNVKRLNKGPIDKLVHASPAINFMAEGKVWFPQNSETFPLDEVQAELLQFTGAKGGKDNMVDTLSYAVGMAMDGSIKPDGDSFGTFAPLTATTSGRW